VTSSLAVSEAAIRVKSMRLIKSCLITRKKDRNMEIDDIFYISLYRKHHLDIEFTACLGELTTEKALT